MTVTTGMSAARVSAVRGPDRSDSQAGGAGSIPVTRSDVKTQVRGNVLSPGSWSFRGSCGLHAASVPDL